MTGGRDGAVHSQGWQVAANPAATAEQAARGQDGRRGGPDPTLLRAGVVDANGGQVAIELTASQGARAGLEAVLDGPNLFPGSARVVEVVAVGQTCRASVDVQCRQCGKERQRFRPEASSTGPTDGQT